MIQEKVSALILIFITLCFGCDKKASDEIDFGSVTDSIYENEYFSLTMKFPPNWDVLDLDARMQLMEMGEAAVAGDDENLKATFNAGEMNTVSLFSIYKYPVGAPVPFNPNISAVAERIKHAPGVKDGSDYLYHSKKLLDLSPLEISYPYGNTTETFSGQEFEIMFVEINANGSTVNQKYYATVLKDYALSFVMSYENEEDKKNIGRSLGVCYI